eukprot:1503720-Rhodomonas_salina.3
MKRSHLNGVEEDARRDREDAMCDQVGPAASEGRADWSFQRSLVGRMWMGTGLSRKERMGPPPQPEDIEAACELVRGKVEPGEGILPGAIAVAPLRAGIGRTSPRPSLQKAFSFASGRMASPR